MHSLGRTLTTEILKTRRTLALGMTVLAPLVIAMLMFASVWDRGEALAATHSAQPWLNFAENMLVYWGLLMLPLFATLETALLSGVDHSQKHWTLLYTLPVRRWSYYAAKQLVSMALIGLSMVVLFGMMLAEGAILNAHVPGLGLTTPIPWPALLRQYGLVFVAAWPLISLQLWFSMRNPGFVLPLAIGIAATVIAVFVLNRPIAQYYPWTMPGIVAASLVDGPLPLMTLITAAAGGPLLACVCGWDVGRRDVL